MYIFILESIGTQELILVGIIALIVFGPRKLPEMAKKLGSMMSEFRKVSGEFKSTWENAVDFENIDEPKKVKTENSVATTDTTNEIENSIGQMEIQQTNSKAVLPEVRNVSKEEFDVLVAEKNAKESQVVPEKIEVKETTPKKSEKTDWL